MVVDKKIINNHMMNMQSRNQYLKEVKTEYLKTISKKGKGILLDEAQKRTKMNRRYLMEKLKPKSNLDKDPQERKRRKQYYDRPVVAALTVLWEIFDRPCGQRLRSSITDEVDRLREFGELKCSDEVLGKLKTISFRTIDEKLRHTKEVERIKQRYKLKIHPLLYQQVPVKVFADQDRSAIGHLQTDLVEHCGASAAGQFINTISNTDINFGWWEGATAIGKNQEAINEAADASFKRFPFPVVSDHIDNGTEILNQLMLRYCRERDIDFSRSRPYKKNDNCLVEQKNKTHVKRFVGYLRYDTQEELDILNGLYSNELRLYKNLFQPVMKLISKERIKGHIKRRYDTPRTPYQRVIECKSIPETTKQALKKVYDSLNPAELKRRIDKKLDLLYKAYRAKQRQDTKVEVNKIIRPRLVRKYIAQREPISVR